MCPLQQQILPYLKAKHEALGREFPVSFPARCMGESGAFASITPHTRPWTSVIRHVKQQLRLKPSAKCCMRWVQSWKSFLRARKQKRTSPGGWPLRWEQNSHSSCCCSFKCYFFLLVSFKAKWLGDCVKQWLKTQNSYPTTKKSTQVTAIRDTFIFL